MQIMLPLVSFQPMYKQTVNFKEPHM